MANKTKGRKKNVRIENLEDLISINLRTIEGVLNETIDTKKAALIFTGSRTVTGTLKLGLEAMKLGVGHVGGINVRRGIERIDVS